MWKKDEVQPVRPTGDGTNPKVAGIAKATPTRTESGRATIGPSISIRGDVTGSEDLLIEGEVDGSVMLDLHSVAVGSQGRVNANITGRVITVEGSVEGDLTAAEQIVLLGSARVQGDIKAPRVVLEDGATFRGLVDMGASPTETAASAPAPVVGSEAGVNSAKTTNGGVGGRDPSSSPGTASKGTRTRTAAAGHGAGSGAESAKAADRPGS